MFRTLLVIAVLALSGCASYGGTQYRERVVYRDGSYYSPSADGYGDYYYAPEYRYSDYDYYDPWGYGFGYGWSHPWSYGFDSCSLRYRPCPYGHNYWGSGWGFSLFFGDPWRSWPYYYGGRHHWRDRDWRDHDWRDRDHDRDRNRRDRDRDDDEDRTRAPLPGTPDDPTARDPNRRPPFLMRDPVFNDDTRERTPRQDRNERRPDDGAPPDANQRPPRSGFVRPMPPPRQGNDAPPPRERGNDRPPPPARDRDEDRPSPPPRAERPRPPAREREERGTRPRPGRQ